VAHALGFYVASMEWPQTGNPYVDWERQHSSPIGPDGAWISITIGFGGYVAARRADSTGRRANLLGAAGDFLEIERWRAHPWVNNSIHDDAGWRLFVRSSLRAAHAIVRENWIPLVNLALEFERRSNEVAGSSLYWGGWDLPLASVRRPTWNITPGRERGGLVLSDS
jgi:hypothetical protein